MKNSHLTLRLPADLSRALARWARAHRIPKSQLVREAVMRYLAVGPDLPPRGSPRLTARALAERWPTLPQLTPGEAAAFAQDIAADRDALPAIQTPWA